MVRGKDIRHTGSSKMVSRPPPQVERKPDSKT